MSMDYGLVSWRWNDGSSTLLLAPGVAIRMLSQLPLTHFSVLTASSAQSVVKSKIITVQFVFDWERWNRQMYRYPNNFGYFKTEFHLTIYLHAMLVTKGRGWDGKLCNQLQTPHGCYILPWPGTGSPATNGGRLKYKINIYFMFCC